MLSAVFQGFEASDVVDLVLQVAATVSTNPELPELTRRRMLRSLSGINWDATGAYIDVMVASNQAHG